MFSLSSLWTITKEQKESSSWSINLELMEQQVYWKKKSEAQFLVPGPWRNKVSQKVRDIQTIFSVGEGNFLLHKTQTLVTDGGGEINFVGEGKEGIWKSLRRLV